MVSLKSAMNFMKYNIWRVYAYICVPTAPRSHGREAI